MAQTYSSLVKLVDAVAVPDHKIRQYIALLPGEADGVPEGPKRGTRMPRRVRSGEERHSLSRLGSVGAMPRKIFENQL